MRYNENDNGTGGDDINDGDSDDDDQYSTLTFSDTRQKAIKSINPLAKQTGVIY